MRMMEAADRVGATTVLLQGGLNPEIPWEFYPTIVSESRKRYPDHESRAAYDRAIELAGNTAEIAYLTRTAISWREKFLPTACRMRGEAFVEQVSGQTQPPGQGGNG
jgi:hypothetical protein